MFFGDWLQRRERLSPNKVALIDAINSGQALTYRQWNQSTNRLARCLRDGLGVTKGDRVSFTRQTGRNTWRRCRRQQPTKLINST